MAAVRACACVCLLFILSISVSSDVQSSVEPTSVGARIARQDSNTQQPCHLPVPLAHGRYQTHGFRCPPTDESAACRLVPGTPVPHHFLLYYTCDVNYQLSKDARASLCTDGRWLPSFPSCLPRPGVPVEKEEALGDICKQVNGSLWTCKNIRNCPKAQQELRKGRLPPICTAGDDPMVCCEPDVKPSQTAGAKAKAMCKQYGEAVYSKMKDPGSDDILKVDNCAAEEPLIIKDASGQDGKDAAPWEYPHIARIGYKSERPIRWVCTGSLISERFVLTAAYCTVDQGRYWVRVRDYNRASTEDDEVGMARYAEYEIIEIIKHPQLKRRQNYNDIALCKLKTELEFNKFVHPICLQTEHQFAGTYAIVTGWPWKITAPNTSNVLRKRNVTIIARKDCSDNYKTTGGLVPNGIMDDSQLCASGTTCEGYLGQLLQLRLKEPYCMYSVVGVRSFYNSIQCANVPAIYTRVSHFVPWIESIVWP